MQSPRRSSSSSSPSAIITFHLFAFFLLLLFSCCSQLISASNSSSRSLSFEVNPGCTANASECAHSTIVHVQSTQPGNDTAFHYLWAFVWGYAPAIFTFETNSAAKLAIDWKQISEAAKNSSKPLAGSIAFGANGTVSNAFALELTQLYFVNFTNNATVLPVSLPETQFTPTQLKATDGEVSYQFATVDGRADYGHIDIVLSAHAVAGRSEEIPHLPFTESSVVLEVNVKNFTLQQTPEKKKYIQSQLISNLTFAFESKESEERLQEHTSIDDEYTPGVFQRFIYDVLSTKAATKSSTVNATAYAEYKPVAYFDDSKTIAKSIKVSTPETEKGLKLATKGSLLGAYFTTEEVQLTALKAFRFGNADDFEEYNYEKERYLQFSLGFGLNAVPEEALSLTLKIVIAVGLGLPMLLFIVSIIYTIVLKVRGRNSGDGGSGFAALTEEVPS